MGGRCSPPQPPSLLTSQACLSDLVAACVGLPASQASLGLAFPWTFPSFCPACLQSPEISFSSGGAPNVVCGTDSEVAVRS